MYYVKTRNWHCKKRVFKLLSISRKWGVVRGDSYDDGDGKFILETTDSVIAWLTWCYFMALRHFSGGWTYIIRPNHEFVGCLYKSIY